MEGHAAAGTGVGIISSLFQEEGITAALEGTSPCVARTGSTGTGAPLDLGTLPVPHVKANLAADIITFTGTAPWQGNRDFSRTVFRSSPPLLGAAGTADLEGEANITVSGTRASF